MNQRAVQLQLKPPAVGLKAAVVAGDMLASFNRSLVWSALLSIAAKESWSSENIREPIVPMLFYGGVGSEDLYCKPGVQRRRFFTGGFVRLGGGIASGGAG